MIGVESDDSTTRLYFSCPSTYGEFDISTFSIRVNYANYSGDSQVIADVYYVTDAESDGENITFSWLVGRNAYYSQGYTRFNICCKIVDNDGNVENELNTLPTTLPVLAGFETTEAIADQYSDILDYILTRLESVSSDDVAAAVESYLAENPITAEMQQTVRNEMTASDTNITLTPNELYVFPEMESLTITLADITDNSIVNEYKFIFTSSSKATVLTLPDTVIVPSSFEVSENMIYEISILENLLSYQTWNVS